MEKETVEKKSLKNKYKISATMTSAVIIGLMLLFLAYKINPDENIYPFTYLICISGYILGWLIAIITTPYDKDDQEKIGKFTTLTGSFLSGYLLSKLDKIIEAIAAPSQALNPLIGGRILLFFCCFGLTFIVVFIYRRFAAN